MLFRSKRRISIVNYRRDIINYADTAFVLVWGFVVLYTRSAVFPFIFSYMLGQGPIRAIAVLFFVVTIVLLIFLLTIPFILQRPKIRQRLLRLKNSYVQQPARLYRYLMIASIYLVISGFLPWPYSVAGLWLSVLVAAPILGLLFSIQPKAEIQSSSDALTEHQRNNGRTFRNRLL